MKGGSRIRLHCGVQATGVRGRGEECGRGSSLLSPCCPFSGSACDVWSRDYHNFVWTSAKRTDSVPQPVQQSDPVFSATPKWSIGTLLIALCTVCYTKIKDGFCRNADRSHAQNIPLALRKLQGSSGISVSVFERV